MSEQFANLAGSALASAYTVGSGSISVVSASGFPASGTFTIVIRDQNTQNVKLLFRVTSVNGAVFSGAAEGTDAAANIGDLVNGTMVSVAMIAQLKADILASVPPATNPNPFIQNLTAPVAANFTAENFNTGAGVVTTQVNNSSPVTSVTVKQHDPNVTTEIAGLDKAVINAAFTVTVALTFTGSGANTLAGVWINDGAKNIIFGIRCQVGWTVDYFTNFAGNFGGNAYSVNTMNWPAMGPLLWLQIQETAATRFYRISSDGITFAQVFSEAVNTNLTTAHYGVACALRGGSAASPDVMITLWSFTETHP
jgi:hypothetical protein